MSSLAPQVESFDWLCDGWRDQQIETTPESQCPQHPYQIRELGRLSGFEPFDRALRDARRVSQLGLGAIQIESMPCEPFAEFLENRLIARLV